MNRPTTKKAALDFARAASRYGHFHDTQKNELFLRCPRCKERLAVQRDFRQSVQKQLDTLVMDHVLDPDLCVEARR